jgi:hypothetical protein
MEKLGQQWAMAKRKEMESGSPKKNNQVLLIYYSYSGQTGVLINRLAAGLKDQGVEVFFEKLKPVKHLRFPVGSILEEGHAKGRICWSCYRVCPRDDPACLQYFCGQGCGRYMVPCYLGSTQLAALRDLSFQPLPVSDFYCQFLYRKGK